MILRRQTLIFQFAIKTSLNLWPVCKGRFPRSVTCLETVRCANGMVALLLEGDDSHSEFNIFDIITLLL